MPRDHVVSDSRREAVWLVFTKAVFESDGWGSS
jgi:hypothetical protein